MSANTEMYTHFVPEFSAFKDSFVQNDNESKFKIKNYKKKDTENEEIVHEFNIVSYKKEYLDNDKKGPIIFEENGFKLGTARSIIFNENNDLICFTPPKSMDYTNFTSKYNYQEVEVILQEFIEGTMMSVFYNKATSNWEISTKSFVGANNHFFKSDGNPITFSKMFHDICYDFGLDFEFLDKEICYNFVFQHPDNRIVTTFTEPSLYLIQMYKIEKTTLMPGWGISEYSSVDIWNYLLELNSKIIKPIKMPLNYPKYLDMHMLQNTHTTPFPNQNTLSDEAIQNISDTGYTGICNWFSRNVPPNIMGIIIHKVGSGERTKIRNLNFEYIRSLRGNQPKLEYHFLELRKQEKLQEYLTYFPEHSGKMYGYDEKLRKFSNDLYNNYVSCYIKKEKPLYMFPNEYKTHMFNIHQHYLRDLKPNKMSIQRSNVFGFVDNLPPRLLMYCLNLKHRPNNIEQETRTEMVV